MGEDNFTSRVKKFFQQYWREITIVVFITALAISLVAYLRERNQRKKEMK